MDNKKLKKDRNKKNRLRIKAAKIKAWKDSKQIVIQQSVIVPSSSVNINTEIILVLVIFMKVALFLKYIKKYINTRINRANIRSEMNTA